MFWFLGSNKCSFFFKFSKPLASFELSYPNKSTFCARLIATFYARVANLSSDNFYFLSFNHSLELDWVLEYVGENSTG